MNAKAARLILSCRTPAGTDDDEGPMKEALAVAETDAGLKASFEAQRAGDEAVAAELLAMPLDEADEALIAEGAQVLETAHSEGRNPVKNPATIAVGVAILFIIAVLVWNFFGRAGTFPDEAIKVATDGAKMGAAEKFDPVEEKASGLQDWFMLKGFDRFHVPDAFADLDIVGVRIFKEDDEPIVHMLAPENHMNVYLFPGQPFGIDLKPEKAWRITESERIVYAIRQENGMCFLLSFRGTKKDMQTFLQKYGATP